MVVKNDAHYGAGHPQHPLSDSPATFPSADGPTQGRQLAPHQ
jgi:hypothetical protein